MSPTPDQSVLRVTATARPIRVAVLVNPDHISASDLDELTYEASTFWGSGYWPIVPTDGKQLSEDWWRALRAIDPDVIYALCTLTDNLYDDLQRCLAPSTFMQRAIGETSAPGARIGLNGINLQAIGSYETAAYHAQRAAVQPVQFLDLRDSAEPGPAREFALRNFGVLRWVFHAFRSFERLPRDEFSVKTTTIADLLSWTSAAPGTRIVPRDLSRLYATRPYELDPDPFSEGFQLVIGDSVDDILCAWNRPLTSNGYAGRDVLWLDTQHAADAATMRAVATWIPQVFWGNNGQRPVTVISYSADPDLIRSAAQIVRDVAHVRCDIALLKRGQFRFRSTPRFTAFQPLYVSEEGARRTELVPIIDGQGLLTVARPAFAAPDSSHEGWMLDLDIECRIDPPRYTNQTDSWHLPRRAQLGHLFASRRVHARVTTQGLPSVSVVRAERAIEITVPTKGRLLQELLSVPHAPKDDRDGSWRNRRRMYDLDLSEQGRRFQGAIDLFGSTQQVGFVLDDSFWRGVLLQLAGATQEHRARQTDRVLRELGDAIKAGVFDPRAAAPSDPAPIAERIVSALHPLQPGRQVVNLGWIRDRYARWRSEEIKKDQPPPQRFDEGPRMQLEGLIDNSVLLQGFMVECPACGLDQWRTVDDFSRHIRCDGCTTQFPCPLEPEPHFRLNQMVVGALSRDAVLPLLHVAIDLTRGPRQMATVFPSTALRFPGENDVITDLDVIALRDGQFLIGEVKSSPGQFNDDQLSRLEAVARAIRPDVVVLVAVGKTWSSETTDQIGRLRTVLAPFDVLVETQLLDW